MFPPGTSVLLRDKYSRDAVHVCEAGLVGAADSHVAATARSEGRAVVTENVADFAGERDVVLVFILEKNLPAGGAQAPALAKILDQWSRANPGPYIGAHWPQTLWLDRYIRTCYHQVGVGLGDGSVGRLGGRHVEADVAERQDQRVGGAIAL
jgi:hypothetical protein